jgi:hypothetical protein
MQMVANVLKDSAFISKVKQSLPKGQEDENYTIFLNIGNSLSVSM